MKRRIKGLVNAILGIFFGGVITSCFPAPAYAGPRPDTNKMNISGKVVDSASLMAIQDVRVDLLSGIITNSTVSYSNGRYGFYEEYYSNIVLAATDIDGTTNGFYYPTNFTLVMPKAKYTSSTNFDIPMKLSN
ncbi:MAG: hypothetical protein A2Y33_03670 [Spirochaetes bacterium GWF1_51_8]|nr:MAG: hypothetical protein A2Y33_03670 [Spirochaetes bacterium GWF1_51_8]